MERLRGLPAPVRHEVVEVEREPRHGEEDHHQDQHLDGPPPAGESPQLLLLSDGSDVVRAPEVVGDVGVGQHGDQQGDEELYEEHHQGDHSSGVARQHQL